VLELKIPIYNEPSNYLNLLIPLCLESFDSNKTSYTTESYGCSLKKGKAKLIFNRDKLRSRLGITTQRESMNNKALVGLNINFSFEKLRQLPGSSPFRREQFAHVLFIGSIFPSNRVY
jgi:hypothetical protein